MKRRQAVSHVSKALFDAGIAEPEAKAKVIVSEALKTGFSQVFSDDEISAKDLEVIEEALRRCASGEPVEYVTGRAYFRYLALEVTPGVLIPRRETELVAEAAIELIRKNSYRSVLDLCTGSGCIAVSVATETGANVTASDISEKALALAAKNADSNGARAVTFIKSDMFEKIGGTFDIIISNPPYISAREYARLDESVRNYEPKAALLAGDGLKYYRIIAAQAKKHINPGGAIVLEIGCNQAQAVSALLSGNGFDGIECMKDYEGRARIVSAFFKER